ncbi:unnamed protein product [Calicophoron daubneyi]|uniref:Protein-lysine N-methyltransferase SMYD4 n=1 Tax=Calicophoron daubneyi TaxID=300641 RepID=A0AAV2TKA2_CALDB
MSRREEINPNFKRFCSLVDAACIKNWRNKDCLNSRDVNILWPLGFDKCQTDFQRVCSLMVLPQVSEFQLLPASETAERKALKCDARAKESRERGNKAWRDRDCVTALHCYTRALFMAETDEEKSLALANRSCVLFSLGAYAEVLEDTQMALKHGYPVKQRVRLLVRRAQSFFRLGRLKEARIEFENAECQAKMGRKEPSTSGLLTIINQGLSQCAATGLCDGNPHNHSYAPQVGLFISDPKPLFPSIQIRRQKKKKNRTARANRCSTEDSANIAMYEIAYGDEITGWQLTAKVNITPGDVILVDKPYGRRIHKNRLNLNCYQCLRRCINLVPCRRCSEVGFCSEDCEKAAWMPDWLEDGSETAQTLTVEGRPCHRFECTQVDRLNIPDYAGWKWLRSEELDADSLCELKAYRDRLVFLPADECIGGPNVSWTAFACISRTAPWVIRSLAQVQSSFGERLSSNSKPHAGSVLLPFSGRRDLPTSEINADSFSAIGWLVTNSDKRTPYDLWQRTVAAVFLTHCLSAGGYPLDWGDRCLLDPLEDNRPWEMNKLPASWAAACILHCLQCVASNAYTITHLEYPIKSPYVDVTSDQSELQGVDLNKLSFVEIASGLYPVLSLLNHSCNPNVIQLFLSGGTCCLYALSPIRCGQVLYGNYGAHYGVQSLSERRKYLLSQYNFQCHCIACEQRWSLFNGRRIILCRKCHAPILLETNGNPNNRTEAPQICHCTASIQKQQLDRFQQIVELDLDNKMQSIPIEFATRPFTELNTTFLDHHIRYLVRMLGYDGLEGLLMRPEVHYDWLQETLKLLLQLRYGCYYVITEQLTHVPRL